MSRSIWVIYDECFFVRFHRNEIQDFRHRIENILSNESQLSHPCNERRCFLNGDSLRIEKYEYDVFTTCRVEVIHDWCRSFVSRDYTRACIMCSSISNMDMLRMYRIYLMWTRTSESIDHHMFRQMYDL
jgi:hypothetical protein